MSLGILAIGLINEALDEGDAQKTLKALQIPAAKLEGVLAEVAQHYQDTLIRAKREKAQVRGSEVVLFRSESFIPPGTQVRGRAVSLHFLSDCFPAPLDSEHWGHTRCDHTRLGVFVVLCCYCCRHTSCVSLSKFCVEIEDAKIV